MLQGRCQAALVKHGASAKHNIEKSTSSLGGQCCGSLSGVEVMRRWCAYCFMVGCQRWLKKDMVLHLLSDEALALAILAPCSRPMMRALYPVSALWARAVQTAAERDAANIKDLQFLPGHVQVFEGFEYSFKHCLRDKVKCDFDVQNGCHGWGSTPVPGYLIDWHDAMWRVCMLLWRRPAVKFHQLFDQCLVNMGYRGVFGSLHPAVHSHFLNVPQLGWAC